MKIRIKGNSVRLRLSKTEIDKFASTGYLEESTEFATAKFTYALASSTDANELCADFNHQKITVYVPTKVHHEWVNTDRVGFENKQRIADDKTLFLLIEKDFVCLDNTFEDQSDNYPNPNAVC
jgi:hypothetical protein